MQEMERPLVTCMITYRKFQYLYETWNSIFMQDYPNIEIIIGDDGSDNLPELELRKYIEKNRGKNIKNVILIANEENHGAVWSCAIAGSTHQENT